MWVFQVIAAAANLVSAFTDVANDAASRKFDWKKLKEEAKLNESYFENSKDNLILQNDLAQQTAAYNYKLNIYLDRITTKSTIDGYLSNPNISKDCVSQYEETGYIPAICSSINLDEAQLKEAIKFRDENIAVERSNKIKAMALLGLIAISFVVVIFYKNELKQVLKNVK